MDARFTNSRETISVYYFTATVFGFTASGLGSMTYSTPSDSSAVACSAITSVGSSHTPSYRRFSRGRRTSSLAG